MRCIKLLAEEVETEASKQVTNKVTLQRQPLNQRTSEEHNLYFDTGD